MAASNKIASVRREYEQVKRLYKVVGKKAFGKAKTSAVYKDYKAVKKAYKSIGSKLGKLTKLKVRG